MPEPETRQQSLYRAHLADLKSVRDITPYVEDRFYCPICLDDYGHEDIALEKVDLGHVWPEVFRNKGPSLIARGQAVLLCKRCNSLAGSRGDIEMQKLDAIREAEKKGTHHGEPKIEILRGQMQPPIKLRARVTYKDPLNLTLHFPVDPKTKKWLRNDPKAQEAFLALSAEDSQVTVLLRLNEGLKPHLAKVGWVTSAYLLAFYALGYRFIIHETLDPVRELILRSFTDEARDHLEFPMTDDFRVGTSETYFADPRIDLSLPLTDDKKVYLRVNFLDYQVHLPFRLNPVFVQQLIQRGPNSDELISEARRSGNDLGISIVCTKNVPHDCLWDYVLGKAFSVGDESSPLIGS